MRIYTKIRKFVSDEDATTAVEYAIMLALIIMVALVGVGVFGGSAGNMFSRIEAELP